MGDKRTFAKPAKEKPFIKGLQNDYVLAQLEQLAAQLAVTVRHEKGDFKSAGCRVEEDKLIFLSKNEPDTAKIEILMRELARFEGENFNLDPLIRERMNALCDNTR